VDFVTPDPARRANGYLAKYSLMNLVKGFVIDRKFLGVAPTGCAGHQHELRM
jgi:hypothetical protein